MLVVLKTACLMILVWILVEDLRLRAVRWYLFPALALLLSLIFLAKGKTVEVLTTQYIINIGFIALQAVILTAYFCLKNRRWVNVFNGLLGLGDALFLLAIAVYLPLFAFIGFYIGSLIVVLTGWSLYRFLVRNSATPIPLAGLQAGIFMLLIFSSWFWPSVNAAVESVQVNNLIY